MATKWVKAKLVLGLNGCVFTPKTLEQTSSSDIPLIAHSTSATTTSVSVSREPVPVPADSPRVTSPTRSTSVSSGLINRFSRSASARSSSSKRICSICLGAMKAGHGHALFTAECSHTFHFACIASSVKHGNHVCPVCRAKWKEVPFQAPAPADPPHGRPNRVSPVNWAQEEGHTIILRRLPSIDSAIRQQTPPLPLFRITEPNSFDDDEPLESVCTQDNECQVPRHAYVRQVDIKTYPEMSAIPRLESQESFAILIHLKAPIANLTQACGTSQHSNETNLVQNSRAPVDLVTVLDVSGSMAGTKIALLKRAMSFVIQNLGSQDRLSVIAFSSTARRLFHLRKMSESGRQQALQAVNSLISNGGTNIAEGLRKGAKVIEERKERNPVCGIILLSDGQDTYTISSGAAGIHQSAPDYRSLLPSSMRGGVGQQIPVHAFGFGADHDSASMHSISETSGGTFSFIEAEDAIQDAFAQCIGGLLSVVVQGLHVRFECGHPGVCINSIKSGSYANQMKDNGKSGSIDVGDLYAEEERDFLVYVNAPEADIGSEETLLLKVSSLYVDPVTKETVSSREEGIKIQRPEAVTEPIVSIEVDRQRNRQHATEAMADARVLAEKGSFSEAVSVLENCRASLAETPAGRSGDKLMTSLDMELKEMQERMKSRHKYEASGRAYVLSGLSSHSWQRATARGDSTSSTSLIQAYQTPSMVHMLNRSQTFGPAAGRSKPPIRPSRSFPAKR